VHLSARVVDQFERGDGGSMRIKAEKDRPGFHGTGKVVGIFRLTPTLADLDGEAPGYVATIEPDETDGDHGWRRTRLMEAVSMFIEQADEPPSRRAIFAGINGTDDHKRTAIARLVEEASRKSSPGRTARSACAR
jgi:hypothetical protein